MPLKDDIWKGKEYERMHLFTASLMRLHKSLVHITMILDTSQLSASYFLGD